MKYTHINIDTKEKKKLIIQVILQNNLKQSIVNIKNKILNNINQRAIS